MWLLCAQSSLVVEKIGICTNNCRWCDKFIKAVQWSMELRTGAKLDDSGQTVGVGFSGLHQERKHKRCKGEYLGNRWDFCGYQGSNVVFTSGNVEHGSQEAGSSALCPRPDYFLL